MSNQSNNNNGGAATTAQTVSHYTHNPRIDAWGWIDGESNVEYARIWGTYIRKTEKGFEMMDGGTYYGTRATLAEAQRELKRQMDAQAAYEKAHDC